MQNADAIHTQANREVMWQLPLNLATRSAKAGTTTVARNDTPRNTNPDELETSGPQTKKVVLVPRVEKKVEEPDIAPDLGEKPPEKEVKSGVPVWVWVVTGVAVAAGAGVGGYFGITALTKPVTGTVTATW